MAQPQNMLGIHTRQVSNPSSCVSGYSGKSQCHSIQKNKEVAVERVPGTMWELNKY